MRARQAVRHVTRLPVNSTFVGTELREIEVGKAFPDIPLRSAPGNEPKLVRDVLPYGGVLYYISLGCGACREAIANVATGSSFEDPSIAPVVVIAIGDVEEAAKLIGETRLKYPVLVDIEQILATNYGVVMFPSYFCLDENQTIQSFGSEIRTSELLSKVIDNCHLVIEADQEGRR